MDVIEPVGCIFHLDRRMPWEEILKRAQRTPKAVALVFTRPDHNLAPALAVTHAALARRIGIIAARLVRLRVDAEHPATVIASESLEVMITLYAARLAGRAIVLQPEEDASHTVRLAHLLCVRVAILAAGKFDLALVRRLRAEAGVEHVLHLNENDHSGSEGNLFEGESAASSLPGGHAVFRKTNGGSYPMTIQPKSRAYLREDMVAYLAASAHADLEKALSDIADVSGRNSSVSRNNRTERQRTNGSASSSRGTGPE